VLLVKTEKVTGHGLYLTLTIRWRSKQAGTNNSICRIYADRQKGK